MHKTKMSQKPHNAFNCESSQHEKRSLFACFRIQKMRRKKTSVNNLIIIIK